MINLNRRESQLVSWNPGTAIPGSQLTRLVRLSCNYEVDFCVFITHAVISANRASLLMGTAWIDIGYRKIPIISPGLIFVQKAFLLGLFLGELIFGGVYNWKEFCVSKWVWLDNKNSLKH